ncbi:MAG: hypothetical protein ACXVCY_10985 [Pseudobdellovibrionaceae bacterium]
MKKYVLVLIALGLAACAHKETATTALNNDNNSMATQEHESFRLPAASQGVDLYTMNEDGLKTINFDRCKGVARLVRDNGALVLQIRDSNCANVVTEFGEWKLNGEGNDGRYIDVTLKEETERTAKIIVASNKYISSHGDEGNADVFFIKIKPKAQMTTLNLNWSSSTGEANLKRCHGTVRAKISNGQLNVIFSDLELCNLFDILSNEGSSVGYDAKEIQKSRDGFSGSFTIPKKFVQVGANAVIVQVYSRYGASEKVKLLFQGSRND